MRDIDRAAAAFRERLAAARWRLLRDGPAPGARNMAIDEALLESVLTGASPPTLRFYAWEPAAVSLGRHQGPEGIDFAFARAQGWDVVRRPTGGRAVLHDAEVTYSLALPPEIVGGAGVRTSYGVLVGILNDGLRQLVPKLTSPPPLASSCASRARTANCFAVPESCDSVAGEGKLVGSAQARRRGGLLQHGSILLDADPNAWTALFGEPGRLVSLRALLGRPVAPEEVLEAVLAGFQAAGIRVAASPE